MRKDKSKMIEKEKNSLSEWPLLLPLLGAFNKGAWVHLRRVDGLGLGSLKPRS